MNKTENISIWVILALVFVAFGAVALYFAIEASKLAKKSCPSNYALTTPTGQYLTWNPSKSSNPIVAVASNALTSSESAIWQITCSTVNGQIYGTLANSGWQMGIGSFNSTTGPKTWSGGQSQSNDTTFATLFNLQPSTAANTYTFSRLGNYLVVDPNSGVISMTTNNAAQATPITITQITIQA